MIDVRDNPQAHRFEIVVDGGVAGFAQYRLRPGVVVFTHTEVDEAKQGRGLAARLAAEALDAVRASGRRVDPQCPYIAKYIREHPAYGDLVAA